jgi:hypothetical protein
MVARIFLCHASEDKAPAVRSITNSKPWDMRRGWMK